MIRTATAIPALLALAIPASADVTPEQVWDHWQRTAALYDITLSADAVTREGSTLVLTGVSTTTPGMAEVVMTPYQWMRLEDLGDGTVRFTMVPEQTMKMTMIGPDGAPIVTGYSFSAPDFEGLIAGTPDRLQQRFTATTIDAVVTPAPDAGVTEMTIGLAGTGLDLTYVSDLSDTGGALASGEGGFERVAVTVSGTDFEDTGFESETTFTRPQVRLGMRPSTAETILPLGYEGMSQLTAEGGTFSMTGTDSDGQSMTIESANGPLELTGSMVDGQLEYAGKTTGITYALTVPGMPAPFAASLAEASGTFAFPVGALGESGPYRFAIALRDLNLEEPIWQMFDPGGAFERGPMTVAFDLSGMMRWTRDIFSDPAAMESAEPPLAADSIAISGLEIAGAGARITGSGAFDIDNAKVAAMQKEDAAPGIIPVSGTLSLQGSGLNRVLDSAMNAGLASAQDLMGVRAMMGMFTVPVEGTDAVTSEVEVTPAGKITINGMPMN